MAHQQEKDYVKNMCVSNGHDNESNFIKVIKAEEKMILDRDPIVTGRILEINGSINWS